MNRHKQRSKGFAVPSRYSIQFTEGTDGTAVSADVSIVPLLGFSQWVVFLQINNGAGQGPPGIGEGSSPPEGLLKLLLRETAAPEETLLELTGFLEAEAAAFIMESGMVTVGDSASLISSLNRDELAGAQSGSLRTGPSIRGSNPVSGFHTLSYTERAYPGLIHGKKQRYIYPHEYWRSIRSEQYSQPSVS